MKVLLLDLDISKRRRLFPNLALMKLSAYHKKNGDDVYLNFPLRLPDITYASSVFTWNRLRAEKEGRYPEGVIKGGVGFEWVSPEVYTPQWLADEVEHIMPDYSLYPKVDFSLGFTSRGCTRCCPWCIVPKKEGGLNPWARLYEFWDRSHRKITLLDNNLLAAPNWKVTMEDLLAEELEVDFNQGLDIRLLNEDNLYYLKRVKTHEFRFAFDDISQEKAIRKGIELLLDAGIRSRHLSFYLLHGFGNDDQIIERLAILHSYDVDIFPMAYRDFLGKEPPRRFLQVPDFLWHGNRGNINRLLRLVGRLPE